MTAREIPVVACLIAVGVAAWGSGYLTGKEVQAALDQTRAASNESCGPLMLFPPREKEPLFTEIALPLPTVPTPPSVVFLDLRTARVITPYSNIDLGVVLVNPEGSARRIQGVRARSIHAMPPDLIALFDDEAKKEMERMDREKRRE